MCICWYTYLLTPWSRASLEKLTGSAASQEIPRIFGTRRFLTVLTSARHLSLSWANSIQSPQPPPTFWRSILILSSHLRLGLPNGLFILLSLRLLNQHLFMKCIPTVPISNLNRDNDCPQIRRSLPQFTQQIKKIEIRSYTLLPTFPVN